MKCDRCEAVIPENDEREFNGQTICMVMSSRISVSSTLLMFANLLAYIGLAH